MGIHVLQLSEPIEANGEKIESLSIRRPKGKDFKRIEGRSMDNPFRLILDFAAILSDIPPSAMDSLSAEDVQEVSNIVGPFLGKSQPTGETS